MMFKKLSKIFFLSVVSVLSFSSLIYAQECDIYDLKLQGPVDLQNNMKVEYNVELFEKNSTDLVKLQDLEQKYSMTYRVFNEGRILFNGQEDRLQYDFPDLGIYEVSVTLNVAGCNYIDTLTVRTYSSVYFYFGQFLQDFNQGLQQNIQQNDILFSTFIVAEDVDDITQPKLTTNLEKKLTDVNQSQIFFFNLPKFSSIFSLIDWFESVNSISFDKKKVVLISEVDPVLLKKFLAPFFKGHEFELYITDLETLRGEIFYSLSVGDIEYVNNFFESPVTFGGEGFNYSISRVVDLLIYYGFSMTLVALLLVTSLCVLLLVFLRQIVGVSIYGLYFPLLFAAIFVLLGVPMTIGFFVLAYIAHLIAGVLHRYINMLVYAKIGTYVTIYVLLSLILLGLFTLVFNYQWNFGGVNDLVVLISFLIMPLAGKKVFGPKSQNLTIKQLFNIVWFLLLSWLLAMMLLSVDLQNWLLVKPELLLVLLVGIIIVGKFTGLQVTEYIRFWPLIKKELMAGKKSGYKKKIKAKTKYRR